MDRNNEGFPRLIYNSDGDSTTLLAFDSLITPEQACRDIEEVAGTGVEGVIVGRALYTGDLTLPEAIEVAASA